MGNYVDTATSIGVIMPDTTFDTATTSLAVKVLARAEGKIRNALAKRFDTGSWTPTTCPPDVAEMSLNLSSGYIYRQTSRGSKDALKRAKDIIDEVTDDLQMILDHKSNLVDTSGSLIPDMETGEFYAKSNTEDYTPAFDVDDPINWRVDADQLTDIANERS